MNVINKDLITIVKEIPETSISLKSATYDNKSFYEYRVEFLIDQIAAYSSEVRTMKVDVAYTRVGKTFALLGSKKFLNANSLNSQILNGKKIRSDFVKARDQDQKNVVIVSKQADIFSRSKKLSKFRLQSTKYIDLAFITDTYTEVIEDPFNNATRAIASDLVKSNLSKSVNKGNLDIYSNLTLRGKDPASLIGGSSLVEDSTTVRRGLGNLSDLRTNINHSFIKTTVGNQNNLLPAQLQSQRLQSASSDAIVPYTFRIPASVAFPNGKFSIICTIRKSNGSLVQKTSFIINHARQLAEYNIPDKLPTTAVQFISKTHAQVNIFNSDPRISNIRLYSRDIPSYQTIAEQSGFIENATIPADWQQKINTARLPIKTMSNKIIRMLPILSTGIVLGNFESKTHNRRDDVVAGTILATSNRGNITVELFGTPANYKYVQFAKRSIDKRQKNWTIIQNSVKIINGIASIEDLDVLNERTYEYTAFLQDTYGNIKNIRTTSIIRTTEYTAGTEIKVDQKSSTITGNGITTTFSITVSLVKDTDTSAILAATKQQGIDSYFEQETLKLSGDLTSITKVNIKRQSLDTGEIKDLGVIEPGEFTDTTTENVIYIFEGLLRGQADLFEEIGIDKTSDKIFNPRDALQRSQIVSSTLTKVPKISKVNFTQKFLSKKSMLRGTLAYGNTRGTDIDASGFLQGRLGITKTYRVEKTSVAVEINNFDLITASENRRMLSFDVNSSSSQKNIDFFIISTAKGSVRSVIGTCHYVDDSTSQYFLDDKTRLKVGKFSYIITPVKYDGTTLDEVASQQFEAM